MRIYRQLSDAELADLLRTGDKAAFTEIYERYWDVLLDAAFQRLKSAEAAKEVVQVIFVDLYCRREQVQLKSTLEAYLKTALKYKVFNLYRSEQVRSNYVNDTAADKDIDPLTPQHILEAKELNDKIRMVSEKMPDKCREVFLLSRFEHLSHQEIATRLNISVSTVKKHMTKALSILKTDFGEHKYEMVLIFIYLFYR